MRLRFLPMILCLLATSTVVRADALYNVNISVYGATATGTITTDGTLGTITLANIKDFSLKLADVHGSVSFSPLTGSVDTYSTGDAFLSATASALFFDFSAGSGDALFFVDNNSNSDLCFTNDASICTNAAGPASVITLNGVDYSHLNLSGKQNITSMTTSQTPEPSSLVLLATGALGAVSAMRRRFV